MMSEALMKRVAEKYLDPSEFTLDYVLRNKAGDKLAELLGYRGILRGWRGGKPLTKEQMEKVLLDNSLVDTSEQASEEVYHLLKNPTVVDVLGWGELRICELSNVSGENKYRIRHLVDDR